MESKFLDQDIDIVSLIGCLVGRNYNKILMETGKLMDNIRITKNGLGSGVDRMFQSSDSAYYHSTDRINHPVRARGLKSRMCTSVSPA